MMLDFELTEKQRLEISAWDATHKCRIRHKFTGAIGGRLSYTFTPTGLGMAIFVECACGETLDLTKSEEW